MVIKRTQLLGLRAVRMIDVSYTRNS